MAGCAVLGKIGGAGGLMYRGMVGGIGRVPVRVVTAERRRRGYGSGCVSGRE